MTLAQGEFVKTVTQPEVFLIDMNRRRWVPDPATLLSMAPRGFDQVRIVDDVELATAPPGEPVPSVLGARVWPSGSLVRGSGPEVFLVEDGKRRWIPDPETFSALGLSWDRINGISNTELNLIPTGLQIPSTRRIGVSLETDLRHQHYMKSTANLLTAQGELAVQTRSWTLTWFGGFKGICTVFGFDSQDQGVFQEAQRVGVDGTAVGTSDRTEFWSRRVDSAAAQRTVKILVTHTSGDNASWDTFVSRLRDLAEVVSEVYKVGGTSKSS